MEKNFNVGCEIMSVTGGLYGSAMRLKVVKAD